MMTRNPTKRRACGRVLVFKDRSLNPEHFPPLTVQSDARVMLRRAMKAVYLSSFYGRADDVFFELNFCLIDDIHPDKLITNHHPVIILILVNVVTPRHPCRR